MQKAEDALAVLKSTDHGVLSTHSSELEGYPFGSLISYAIIDVDGRPAPVFIMSDLAQHTINTKNNPRVCLTVLEKSEYPQNATRISWVGDISQRDDVLDAYIEAVPSAKKFLEMHDFHAYTISCLRIRYIQGFGKIFWVEPEEWSAI